MSLRTKFVLMIAMLGLAVAGGLVAAYWAFGMLHEQLSVPLSGTASALDALGHVKRNIEEQAVIPNTGVVIPSPHESGGPTDESASAVARGVRGPFARLEPRLATAEEITSFDNASKNAGKWLAEIEADDSLSARIGVGTWRNMKERIKEAQEFTQRWFKHDDEAARTEARRKFFQLHELIESAELRILRDSKSAVAFGEEIRSLLLKLLAGVFVVAILSSVLAVELLRRWVQRPVESLRRAAAQFARGDLQYRVPVAQRDELGLLAAEVNHMAQMVQVMQDERVERERLAAVGGMLRRIVHNVRNPLAGIRGLAEVTRIDLKPGTPDRENMDLIVTTVDTFERWLTELLDATSPAAIDIHENDVRAWLGGIVEAHRPQAHSKNVALIVEKDAVPETAAFDPKHMDHALSALVSNAIEASPSGGTVWVGARRAAQGGAWELTVVDQGPGIPPDVLPRLFEPHFTTKRHGTGLGLAMAQQVIRGHGGRLMVRNGHPTELDRRGACFVVTMPIVAATTPK